MAIQTVKTGAAVNDGTGDDAGAASGVTRQCAAGGAVARGAAALWQDHRA